jgi:plastocyanin
MRFLGLALTSGAVILGACGGGENKAADTAAKTDTGAMAAPTTTPTPGGGAATMMPITGTTYEVKMVGDAQGYRFEPANITAKAGDGIKFVVVSMPPHNVAFDPATVPAESKDQLWANMPNATDGSSPMLVNPNETWTLSLGGLKPGKYPFHCTPHLAMNMKGEITITP